MAKESSKNNSQQQQQQQLSTTGQEQDSSADMPNATARQSYRYNAGYGNEYGHDGYQSQGFGHSAQIYRGESPRFDRGGAGGGGHSGGGGGGKEGGCGCGCDLM
jgi:hypothetical protein